MFRRALVSGSFASLTSTIVLLHCGARETRSAITPVNAVSHWIWENRALRQHNSSVRYSLTGYGIHHAASIFWALCFEALALRKERQPTATETATTAATVAALACVVDMRFTPDRLTPGFEHHLSKKALFGVYTAFAIGLALHGLLGGNKRR
jgi:hypothetical protein